jgi:hypothetical protein
VAGIRKQWDDLSPVGQNEFLSTRNSDSFDCSDPTSVHSCPGRAPEGRYDLAYSAGCACGLSTSGYALNGCVVVSSLVRLNGSHELAQRVGMYSPLVGGRFSASSWFSTVADVTEEGKSYSRPAAPKAP